MGAGTVTGTHAATARMDIHEVARQLHSHLGPTLVAALAGTPDRKLPIRWAKSDGPTLSEAVRILGQYPTTPGDGPDSDAGRDALHRATELHQQAKRLCEARPPSTDATAVSAVLMTTQRTLDVVGRPQRATDAD